jgi:type I restriction enzyme S subunit
LKYALLSSSFLDKVVSFSTGVSYPSIKTSLLSSFKIPVPPLETQHAIVKFLDAETAHIDAGIANMESLIALLIEKRSTLISEAVTRGIPGEHTDFKDSGVAWLGEIPVEWKINKLKHFAEAVKRPAVEGQENITAFRNGRVTLRKNVRASGYTEADKEHGYQSIHENDLVIHNMDAFAGAIGVSDAYGKSTPVYTVCEVKENASPMFLAYALRIMAWEGWILSLSRGIRERSTDFRWAASSNQYIPSPSKEEQERIVLFIENEAKKIDTLIHEAEQSVSLMKEKRQVLISDVVTGKIDVRNSAN